MGWPKGLFRFFCKMLNIKLSWHYSFALHFLPSFLLSFILFKIVIAAIFHKAMSNRVRVLGKKDKITLGNWLCVELSILALISFMSEVFCYMRKIDPYLDKSVVTYFHYVKLSILISQFLHFSIEQTRADLIIYE